MFILRARTRARALLTQTFVYSERACYYAHVYDILILTCAPQTSASKARSSIFPHSHFVSRCSWDGTTISFAKKWFIYFLFFFFAFRAVRTDSTYRCASVCTWHAIEVSVRRSVPSARRRREKISFWSRPNGKLFRRSNSRELLAENSRPRPLFTAPPPRVRRRRALHTHYVGGVFVGL